MYFRFPWIVVGEIYSVQSNSRPSVNVPCILLGAQNGRKSRECDMTTYLIKITFLPMLVILLKLAYTSFAGVVVS